MIVLNREECVEMGRWKGDPATLDVRPRFTGLHVPWPQGKPAQAEKGHHKWVAVPSAFATTRGMRLLIVVNRRVQHGAVVLDEAGAREVAEQLLRIYNLTGHERSEYDDLARVDVTSLDEVGVRRMNQLLYSLWGGWADGPPPWKTRKEADRG